MNLAKIKEKVKLLTYIDSTAYDSMLDSLILSAVEKLKKEGVTEVEETSSDFDLYCIAISYDVSLNMGNVGNISYVERRYKNLVMLLRDAKKSGM